MSLALRSDRSTRGSLLTTPRDARPPHSPSQSYVLVLLDSRSCDETGGACPRLHRALSLLTTSHSPSAADRPDSSARRREGLRHCLPWHRTHLTFREPSSAGGAAGSSAHCSQRYSTAAGQRARPSAFLRAAQRPRSIAMRAKSPNLSPSGIFALTAPRSWPSLTLALFWRSMADSSMSQHGQKSPLIFYHRRTSHPRAR